jgi:hypothetical protein
VETTLRPPSDASPLPWVGGRWRVEAAIGRGAFGSVWRAVDEATGEHVAVKFLEPETTVDLARVRKEIAALRLLRVPGVVELLDAGTEKGRHYLVMELVAGLPFPGRARGWSGLAPLVARLCETLRHIHAHGVVHRDLKPSNVLVTDEGRVVVLDFGIARGDAIGSTVTGSADVVGTPLYLAPEQVHREAPVDGRADLYALGHMIYEALAGNRAFVGRSAQEVLVARVTCEAAPLDVPGVPERVVRLVAALLARRPDDRPASADAVLAALEAGEEAPLPWLGPRTAIDAVVDAIRAGRPMDVWGLPGSGRSRVLREAVEATRGEREIVVLVAGERPLESLAPLLGTLVGDAPIPAAEGRLRDALGSGMVVVADDAGRLDRWTRAVLERMRDLGAVLRVTTGPGGVGVDPLAEADLRALFHGPDVVLHLREDAAHALFQRTGGVPARVAEEVRGWVARGGARWDHGRLRVDRSAIETFSGGRALMGGRAAAQLEAPLDALLAWVLLGGSSVTAALLVAATGLPAWEIEMELGALEEAAAVRRMPDGRLQALTLPRALGRWSEEERAHAHRRLAAVMATDSHERLLHLAAAGDTGAIPDAAVTFARSLLDTGAAGRALAALHYAVAEVQAARVDVTDAVLVELARAALADGGGPALREARRTLTRAGGTALAALLAAWEAAGERRYADAEAAVAALPPFADDELDAWRVGLPVRVAVATDLDEAERRLAALLVDPDSVVGRRRTEWLGHLRYRQRRYVEAAELHARAASTERSGTRRANSFVNAGLAWRDGHVLGEALDAFRSARALAAAGRLTVLEGHAVVGERTVLYRLGAIREPDLDVIAAIDAVGDLRLLAPACLNEAAVAWRAGDNVTAEVLARRAAGAWDHAATRDGWLLAMGLACAAGSRRAEAEALAPHLAGTDEGVRWQAARLLGMAGASVLIERAPEGRASYWILDTERDQ